ncbi:T9SS type A sorting domain-containing protein [Fluviicola taffensis]|uniref:Secretion system C-terminal sorting domain-containing protein n=1 Tax=Fluviicola taffensis (strain DSM 16823 / NCIMB 13979 / RW262) TaxID=755732 RepID=F2IC42_FLUTR|nr:T9SS type A sorting domain-containing protein [Fluviicola taffensis]AEA43268.1 hypothetical protein Fluta_1273 [Fluviicola taffensis DSM 16823]
MKIKLTLIILMTSVYSFAQNGWSICNTPTFDGRVDDIFMVDFQTGYAVCGDGKIAKTIDSGDNWIQIHKDTTIYCRSVEFVNTQKGFVGSFSTTGTNVLQRTTDGGTTWSDLTSLLHPKAKKGICGLAAADPNTIYGCGNWFQDSAYIVKSNDGGDSWSFIDMSAYASSLIDMHFISKDTGFVTGTGLLPLQNAVILYTTDGGVTWSYKFQNTTPNEFCWKIQHLTNNIYFASIEDLTSVPASILKSMDGGMSWTIHQVTSTSQDIQGVGFIDSLKGWTGGGTLSFETNDGGITWDTIFICSGMNRVFRVNENLLFASGFNRIWRYDPTGTASISESKLVQNHTTIHVNCYPNPVNDNLTVKTSLSKSTHSLLILFDAAGKEIKIIDNTDRPKGDYTYNLNTADLPRGNYFIILKTHEDKATIKIVVNH